jgi:hypothetical protein
MMVVLLFLVALVSAHDFSYHHEDSSSHNHYDQGIPPLPLTTTGCEEVQVGNVNYTIHVVPVIDWKYDDSHNYRVELLDLVEYDKIDDKRRQFKVVEDYAKLLKPSTIDLTKLHWMRVSAPPEAFTVRHPGTWNYIAKNPHHHHHDRQAIHRNKWDYIVISANATQVGTPRTTLKSNLEIFVDVYNYVPEFPPYPTVAPTPSSSSSSKQHHNVQHSSGVALGMRVLQKVRHNNHPEQQLSSSSSSVPAFHTHWANFYLTPSIPAHDNMHPLDNEWIMSGIAVDFFPLTQQGNDFYVFPEYSQEDPLITLEIHQ